MMGRHTIVQSAIEKTATPLQDYGEPEALGHWAREGPELAVPPNRLSLFLVLRILWNVFKKKRGLDQVALSPGSDLRWGPNTFFWLNLDESVPAVREVDSALERDVHRRRRASPLTGMYGEWKVVEHE